MHSSPSFPTQLEGGGGGGKEGDGLEMSRMGRCIWVPENNPHLPQWSWVPGGWGTGLCSEILRRKEGDRKVDGNARPGRTTRTTRAIPSLLMGGPQWAGLRAHPDFTVTG